MAGLNPPGEVRADYLYRTDNQGKSNVYTPVAMLPPASSRIICFHQTPQAPILPLT
jgi:hypothetical protein